MMRLIDRESENFVVQEFSDWQAKVLERYFVLRQDDLTEADVNFAEELHDDMLEHGWRVECDCQDSAKTPPLLSAASPQSLKRMPSPNPPHHKDCIYFNRPGVSVTRPSRARPNESLSVHGEFVERSIAAVSRRGGGSDRPRLTKVSSVLFRLLEAAGANKILKTSDGIMGPSAKQIWGAARTVKLIANSKPPVGLQEWLRTSEVETEGMRRLAQMKEAILTKGDWPAASRPQGFFVCVVTHYEEAEEYYALAVDGWSRPVLVDTRPHVFAEATASLRPPYIAIVSFARPNRHATKVLGMRCYLQPCLSETNWMPIDSQNERETARELVRWRDRLPTGCSVTIEKPLFNLGIAGTEQVCRPDFLLKVEKQGGAPISVAVETMGIDNAEYEESKRTTHPLMLRIADYLVVDDRRAQSAAERQRRLADFIGHLNDAVLRSKQADYPSIR